MRDFPIRTPDFFRPLVRRSLTSGEMGGAGTRAVVWGAALRVIGSWRMTRDGKHAAVFRSVASHRVSVSFPLSSHRLSHMHMHNDDVRAVTQSSTSSLPCRFRVSMDLMGLRMK